MLSPLNGHALSEITLPGGLRLPLLRWAALAGAAFMVGVGWSFLGGKWSGSGVWFFLSINAPEMALYQLMVEPDGALSGAWSCADAIGSPPVRHGAGAIVWHAGVAVLFGLAVSLADFMTAVSQPLPGRSCRIGSLATACQGLRSNVGQCDLVDLSAPWIPWGEILVGFAIAALAARRCGCGQTTGEKRWVLRSLAPLMLRQGMRRWRLFLWFVSLAISCGVVTTFARVVALSAGWWRDWLHLDDCDFGRGIQRGPGRNCTAKPSSSGPGLRGRAGLLVLASQRVQ